VYTNLLLQYLIQRENLPCVALAYSPLKPLRNRSNMSSPYASQDSFRSYEPPDQFEWSQTDDIEAVQGGVTPDVTRGTTVETDPFSQQQTQLRPKKLGFVSLLTGMKRKYTMKIRRASYTIRSSGRLNCTRRRCQTIQSWTWFWLPLRISDSSYSLNWRNSCAEN
jgi:hypothetical protein